jgi:hypothetical protein
MPKLADDLEVVLAERMSWWDKLPDKARRELLEIKQRFAEGKYALTPYRLASAVIALANERGWKLPVEKTVATWLQRN